MPNWRAERGYAMAALLVALGVMSVMLTVVMPVWKQAAQREKEAELIFRGQQYARAIGLFQRRAGPGALPPNIDVLVEQRFLRRKYKDPITGDDFQPLLAGQAAPAGQPGTSGRGGAGAGQAGGRGAPGAAPVAPSTGVPGATGAVGGIQGVVSKSRAKSIRLYNGRQVYNEWAFVFVPQQQAAGAATPGGAPGPGGPGPGGGRGDGRGGGRGPGRGVGPGAPGPGGPGGGRGFGPPGTPFGAPTPQSPPGTATPFGPPPRR